MSPVLSVYKPIGLTPLETLTELRISFPEIEEKVLAYAGRLDPMAEGVLLVLVGEECKKRETYQLLPKSYEVTGVFGITTDTYDALGVVEKISPHTDISKIIAKTQLILPEFVGTYNQQYPPYSSARVKGKPLFYWARAGKLDTITIPSKVIEVSSIQIKTSGVLTGRELFTQAEEKINKITGDFRQQEILDLWEQSIPKDALFPFIQFVISSSQGAYMRSLIHEMGALVGTGAIAFHIKRLAVGEYHWENALKFK